MKIFYNIFQKVLSELEKKRSSDFHWRPRMKVELFRENGKIHLTRDQKATFYYYFEKSMELPKKHSDEAVCVMPSVTGCQTLGTLFRKAKPILSDRGPSRFTFAANFNGAEPEEKTTINSTKTCSKFFIVSHNLSTPWQKSRMLGFEKRN